MEALVLTETVKPQKGSLTPLVKKRVPLPEVPTGHVLVKVKAASLNHRDLYIREGLYPAITYGAILGSDAAGVVVSSNPPGHALVGSSVVLNPTEGWESDPDKPESMVYLRGMIPLAGTFAEYIAVPIADAIPVPKHMSFVEASTLPCAGVTAYRAVFTCGQLKQGQKVLIPGIGGGVALFALQLAVAAGATVYVTSSSEDKIAKAVKMGAVGGVNYREKNWPSKLEEMSGGFFDLVVDGSSGPNIKSFVRLLGPGGIISVFGAVAGSSATINVPYLWFKHITIRGVTMGSLKEFRDFVAFMDKHKIRPIVESVYNFGDYETMFDTMRRGSQFGKLVLRIETEREAKL